MHETMHVYKFFFYKTNTFPHFMIAIDKSIKPIGGRVRSQARANKTKLIGDFKDNRYFYGILNAFAPFTRGGGSRRGAHGVPPNWAIVNKNVLNY